jgi:hypothetical protein
MQTSEVVWLITFSIILFSHGATAPSGLEPPSYRGLTIIFRHIQTFGGTPLDKWSAHLRDYLTTHNTPKTYPCRRRESNRQSKKASGSRPTI